MSNPEPALELEPTLEFRMKAILGEPYGESYTEMEDLFKDPKLAGTVIRVLYDHLRQAEKTISRLESDLSNLRSAHSDLKFDLSEQDRVLSALDSWVRLG